MRTDSKNLNNIELKNIEINRISEYSTYNKTSTREKEITTIEVQTRKKVMRKQLDLIDTKESDSNTTKIIGAVERNFKYR